ncbi:MAG: short-chain fatty acid transporter [Deltaproteobacteria bacterium]|nr:short-chain fatty acid transporter [Deltaproteobacteria bacterium]
MDGPAAEGWLARVALRFTAFSERYVPDAFVFALIATVLVFGLGLGVARAHPVELVAAWGKGFWELIPFTMQMALVIITGYVLATARPVARLIVRLAGIPRSPRQATMLVAVFAMLTSWLNWGFSLIFSSVLAREVARRRPDTDYRALAATSFLGLGSIWAQGLSGSAALQMCTPGALPPAIRDVVARGGVVEGGLIPLRHTIFLWQSLLAVAVEILVVTLVVCWFTPSAARARSAASLGVDLGPVPGAPEAPAAARLPGERLEHSPVLNLVVVALGGAYLTWLLARSPSVVAAINLNVLNLGFLLLGFLLHWTPARLMRAVREATPAVWGVILQFPFYAGIAGMIVYTHLNERIAGFLVSISSRTSFPPLIALYSAGLGVFVPSGGSKWVIEAPYVMAAAHDLRVHLGWMVAVYDLGEALANLVQPFWMLPTLAILGLKARDVMGYTFIVFLVLLPVVLVLVTLLGTTLSYPL